MPKSKKKVALVNGPTNHDPDVLATNNTVHYNINNNGVSDCIKNNILPDCDKNNSLPTVHNSDNSSSNSADFTTSNKFSVLDNTCSNSCTFCNTTDKTDIQCNICNVWCHSSCAGISLDVLKFISNNRYINFLCISCVNNNKEVSPTNKRLDKIEKNMEKLMQHVTSTYASNAPPPPPPKAKSYRDIVKEKLVVKESETENTVEEYKIIIKNANIDTFSFPDFKLNFASLFPNMKIKSAYKKPNKDVTVILFNEFDAMSVISKWNQTYFGSNTSVSRPGASVVNSVIIKDMPLKLMENELLNEIQEQYNSATEITRFKKDNKLMPVVKVDFNSVTDFNKCLTNGVTVKNMFFNPVAYRALRKPLRCYNCNKFGHISSNCKSKKTCSTCAAEGHCFKDCSSNEFKCINCSGAHKAISTDCPVYKQILEKIN